MKQIVLSLCVFISQFNFAQNKIGSTGNVGIGTNNPTVPLDVFGTVSNQTANSYYNENLRLMASTANDHSTIALGAVNTISGTGAGQWTLIRYPAQNNYMFGMRYNNATDFFNILTNGNVGIGVFNPTNKLDVSGSGLFQGAITSSISDAGGGKIQLQNPSKSANGIASMWAIYNMTGVYGNSLQFWAYDNLGCGTGLCQNRFTIMDNGNVGIGATNPSNKLEVNGTIHSKEVKVDMNGWSDFVFKKEYNLPTLEEVEKHIAEKGHLENIPREEEVLKNGIDLGEMNAKLLQKIEEMTLYIIDQNRRIEKLESLQPCGK
ncbi:hypothetical protein [Flavobacterium anhuiense]|uniref:hypothetical protein n=1 Tax=Flavobacterium anhuiense TaxID=459526 RepID=UPI0034D9606C